VAYAAVVPVEALTPTAVGPSEGNDIRVTALAVGNS
jgi:hypothetical protein